jgi:crotonobetainyl-CoA hydratase
MSDSVKIERRGPVCEITLDRPKANAIDVATSRALYAAFAAFQEDSTLSVAILTGGGERFFSAGWDLKAGEAVDADHGPGGFAGLTEFFNLDKPVIAAVNGLALGGGFELALAADLIVASEAAEFGMPEVGLGIIADSGGMQHLPKRLPRAIAYELAFTGRRMSAAEAAGWGLINRVVSASGVMAEARELAANIANNAPLALRAAKAVMLAGEGRSVQDTYAFMRDGHILVYNQMLRSQDAEEGPRAFGEKRRPEWRGI